MINDIYIVLNGVRAAVMATFFYILAFYAFLVINTLLGIKNVTFIPGISIIIRKYLKRWSIILKCTGK